jgi:hypothetical protein
MKRLIYTLTAVIMLGFSTADVSAASKAPAKELTAQQQAQLEQIKQRVEEIKSIDKANLSPEEKRALKTELREMKKQARAIGEGGVYLSVGTIIIILLLLILLL